MTLPDVNLHDFEERKTQNRRERLEFVRAYAKWVKKTPNKVWSAQQKKLIG